MKVVSRYFPLFAFVSYAVFALEPGVGPRCGISLLASGGQTRYSSALKSRYFAGGDPSNPIDFSFEAEVFPHENPRIVDYYRVPEVPLVLWKRMPRIERLERLLDRIEISEKDQTVAVRMPHAPPFIADRMIRETRDSTRVEIGENNVEFSLIETESQIAWLFKNVGAVSLQGQVAFHRKNLDLQGAGDYIKADYDVSQAEALERGYARYLSGGPTPARNFAHRSLGVPGKETFDRIEAQIASGVERKHPDMMTKYIYATTFRDDLYGPGKVGFEVRHCHKRMKCLISRMHEIAMQVQNEFRNYHLRGHQSKFIAVQPATYRELADPIQQLFSELERHLAERHKGQNVGGAPFSQRFAFPFLDWAKHPYVEALPHEAQEDFVRQFRLRQYQLRKALVVLAESDLPIEKKIDRVLIETAKWGYEMRLADALRDGRERYLYFGRTRDVNVFREN